MSGGSQSELDSVGRETCNRYFYVDAIPGVDESQEGLQDRD